MRLFTVLLFTALLGFGNAYADVEAVIEVNENYPTLTVHVTGFDNITGFTRMAIYDSEEGFPEDSERSVLIASEPVIAETVTFSIETLPPGTYAISVYHDEDGDGELDMKFYGPPSEKVAASNNATGRMGPPSFEDASFILGTEPLEMTIEF